MGDLIRFNHERACFIGRRISMLKHVIEILRRADPQFKAVETLISSRGVNEASILIIANSLISYQLSVKGEEYWAMFSHYFSDKGKRVSLNEFTSFMGLSGNTRLLNQKKQRLARFLSSSIVRELSDNGLKYCIDLLELNRQLSRLYGGDYSKTVVFAVKMYSYLCEASGVKPPTAGIKPPLDMRNALFLLSSCIVEGCGADTECIGKIMSGGHRSEAVNALLKVCECGGLNCIELDVFTWLVTGVLRDTGFNVYESSRLIKERYGVEIPVDTLQEISLCAKS
ncbi:N-glycosylase/DNA lyase [Desulfurococcus amylolyticus]|uniref:N-glycosylase/DNA lyase n=1 Tax=Desulfurococcus amylolyticus TaxID=94694 RepID=UPI001F1B6252|nr:N-glycosylase/DNA lyase [Desulfurococcus amylolyticus]